MQMKTTALALLPLLLLCALRSAAQSGITYRLASKYPPNLDTSGQKTKAQNGSSLIPTTPPSDTVWVGILTDLSRSTAGSGEEQARIGNGKLGVSFVTRRFYGDLSFALFTNDRNVAADTAFFYNNLLLAQNRSSGLSEVSGSVGTNGLLRALGAGKRDTSVWNDKPCFKWFADNFGLFANFRSSNQVWRTPTDSVDVLLNAVSILATVQLADWKILSTDWEHLQIMAFGGWTTRRLRGNYLLDSTNRQAFLGTDQAIFNGFEFGIKLEIGPFYGRASFTKFSTTDAISSFSGLQMAVNLGAAIQLNMKGVRVR